MPEDIKQLRQEINSLKKRVSALEQDYTEPEVEPEQVVDETSQTTFSPPSNSSSNALGILGGVVLSFGLIFLIAYAIDQGWISRLVQITMGIVVGVAIMIGGHLLHSRMPLQGSIISGVGVITAYFSIYSGYVFEAYRQATNFSVAIASTLLILVLAAALLLAHKQNSPVLLLEALFLSFITTFMSSLVWLSVIYVSLLVLAFCLLAYKNDFAAATAIGAAITFFMTLINVIRASDVQSFVMIGLFAGMFMVLFFAKKQPVGVLACLAGAYSLLLIPLSSTHFSTLTLFAAAFSLLLYAYTSAQQESQVLYLVSGIAFLMLWVPLQFEGYLVVNLWIIIAALLAFSQAQTKSDWLIPVSAIAGALSALALISQLQLSYVQSAAILSLVLFSVACFIVSYRYALDISWAAHPYYLAGLAALVLLASLELSRFWITISWAGLAFVSLLLGLKTNRPVPKQAGVVLLLLSVAKLFMVDTMVLDAGLRIIAYITLGVLLLVGSMLYKKYL